MSASTDPINVRRNKGQIWSHVRKKWLLETPEEAVRQEYLCVLVIKVSVSAQMTQ